MTDEKRETVVVEGDRRNSAVGWIVGVIVVILIILFLMTGGFGLFTGGSDNAPQGGNNTSIQAPNTVNGQPSTGK